MVPQTGPGHCPGLGDLRRCRHWDVREGVVASLLAARAYHKEAPTQQCWVRTHIACGESKVPDFQCLGETLQD